MAKQLQASLKNKIVLSQKRRIFRLLSWSEVSLYIQSHNISVAVFELLILYFLFTSELTELDWA